MMKIIDSITINYFRSIYKASLKDCSKLNIISGLNDVGKSNILKAMNLFFNGQTSWKEAFNFAEDFSKQRRSYVQKETIKGKQYIQIAIKFQRPKSYKKSLPKHFTVTRTWTRDKNQYDQKDDIGKIKLPKTVPAAKNSLTKLLNRIHFEYVPAVKDKNYYKYLLISLQSSLLDKKISSDPELSQIAGTLANKIQDQVKELKDDFEKATQISTSIKPPDNIEELFNSFIVKTQTGSGDIPLSFRGDGIQTRYIGAALNYIATRSNKFFIWGFEEPENSLEYSALKTVVNNFTNTFCKESQIFVTSHSPEFISIQDEKLSKYRVFRKDEKSEVAKLTDSLEVGSHEQQLMEDLGMLKIQQEVHAIYEERIKDHYTLKKEVKRDNMPIVIVEGKYDKIILEAAWEKLRRKKMPFKILTPEIFHNDDTTSSGGTDYESNILKTASFYRYNKTTIGIFDHDEAGIKAFYKLKKLAQFSDTSSEFTIKGYNGLYAFTLPEPPHRSNWYERKNLPLEYYFTDVLLEKYLSFDKAQIFHNNVSESEKKEFETILKKSKPNALQAYRKIKNGKKILANTVKMFSKKDFVHFEILFKKIEDLINKSPLYSLSDT